MQRRPMSEPGDKTYVDPDVAPILEEAAATGLPDLISR
jgi:hypothetical protein